MAVGDHYMLQDLQTYLGVGVINTWHYFHFSGGGAAADLVSLYSTTIMQDLISIQVNNVTHVALQAINLDDLTDYNLTPLVTGNIGAGGSDALPPFVAWGFRLIRASRGHHHGAKRVVGVEEGNQVDGVATSAFLPTLQDVADRMGAPISGGGVTYHPQIYRAPNTIKPGYNNAADYFDISGGLYTGIVTQNSRKFK